MSRHVIPDNGDEPTFRDQLREAIRELQGGLDDPVGDYVEIPASAAEVLLHAASAHAAWMGVPA